MKSFIVFFTLCVAVLANQKSYDQYKVFTVNPDTPIKIDLLASLQDNVGIDFWDTINRVGKPVRVMIAPESLEYFELTLAENDIQYDIIIDNVRTIVEKERAYIEEYRTKKAMQPKATVDFEHFWTIDEVYTYLDEIAEQFPDVVEIEVLGQSYNGRQYRAVKISTSGTVDGTRPIILADATIHAREWIATMVAMHLIHELVEHSDEHADMLNGLDWVIVPIANPDGFAYTFSNERFWRKTRSSNAGSTCVGVDPNRNFDYEWLYSGGASDNPCSETFRGTEANTEVEVRMLSELMNRWDSTKLYLAIHSYGQYLLYPWGYDRLSIDNWEDHEEVGSNVRNAIRAVSGTNYTLGASGSTLYLSSGVSIDYAAGGANIPYSFTIELPGGGSNGFDIPASRIPAVLAETFPGMKAFADFMIDRYVLEK